MAGQGPLPGTGKKPDGQRRRRNKEKPPTELDGDARVDDRNVPKLEGEHNAQTVKWWDRWVRSPQATMFTPPAWSRLEMLVDLVDEYWNPGTAVTVRKQLAAEIRLNETLMLAMPADQLRAKLDLRPKTDTGKAPATARTDAKRSAARKDRILQAVPDAAAG